MNKKARALKRWQDKKKIKTELEQKIVIKMQPGPQEQIGSCPADIAFFGGAAYGGKSYYLLCESARCIDLDGYRAVIFRRTTPQITAGGGLWDTASKIYPHLLGKPDYSHLLYKFPAGAQIKFSHLENEVNIYDHQGAQYSFIGFDELTHFSRKMFFYLLTRNRNPAGFDGVIPYCRATMNPDADSWIREFIDWWIDPITGYAIPERSGVVKYFTIRNDIIEWVDESWKDDDGNGPKSFTFIPSYIENNPIGLISDPTYRSNLLSQDMVTKERLLKGNWNITTKGGMFNPTWFNVVEEPPQGIRLLRYWDRAATIAKKEGDDPDWTAGSLCGFYGGDFYIIDIKHFRGTPGENHKISRQTAELDGYEVEIGVEQEPGSAGVEAAHYYMTDVFKGFIVHIDKTVIHKEERAKPWAKLAEQGHVFIVKDEWNRKFMAECGSFPFGKKDMVDSVSGAYKLLSQIIKVYPKELPDLVEMTIEWNKINSYNSFHYGSIVQQKDLSIWCLAALWNNVKMQLYIYDAWSLGQAIASQIAVIFKTKMNLNKYSCEKILCNDIMDNDTEYVKSVRRLINKELKELKVETNVKEAIHYEAYGAINATNQLLSQNKIFFSIRCKDVVRQMAQWKIVDNKPTKIDCGYCEALGLIITELKKKQILERALIKQPDYVRKEILDKAIEKDKELRKAGVNG